ncbi:MAG: polyphosphate kinase 1 [Bacteroidota bacterium]
MEEKKMINREISWLSFNHRVLQEAADPNVPLVERIRFLGIFSNNLDEFFKVRVATIKRMIDIQVKNKKVEGENPREILKVIQRIVLRLQHKFHNIFKDILHLLEEEYIYILDETRLNTVQGAYVRSFFRENILPFLNPVMLHHVDCFPALKDKSIYLAVKLTSKQKDISTEYALIELPTDVTSRFLVLPEKNEKKYIILLDDVIRYCLKDVFSILHFDRFEAYTVKLTRDAELDLDNDLSQSFLEQISKGVSGRKTGQPVRFVYDNMIPGDMLDFFIKQLKLESANNIIPGARYHNFKDFMAFPNVGGPHLEYVSTPPINHHLVKPGISMFETISGRDLLFYVPYHKFANLVRLLQEAAIDPTVKEIYITLYRVAKNSTVINTLMNAARNGKQVTVTIEIQARFDEKANIYWARKLEEAGAKVIFGLKGLKIHSKLCLINREEEEEIKSYAIVGTGNFHEGNAKVYTDFFLATKDSRITEEVARVFKLFDKPYLNYTFKHLLVSPTFTRKRFYDLVENEIVNAKEGKDAWIFIKVNNIVDKGVVKKLWQASHDGVKVRLIVRSICSVYTGDTGMGKNIEAISIVDKFLEHPRVFVFANGGDSIFYIGSADLMTRNLDHRIEVAAPVFDPVLQNEIMDILEIQLRDNVKARIINDEQDNPYKSDNSNTRVRSQIETYKYYSIKHSNSLDPLIKEKVNSFRE